MRNLFKRYGMLITGIVIGAMLAASVTAIAASILSADYNANKVIFDGKELELERPLISVIDDEMTDGAFANYMPVRAVLEAMGYSVAWDSANSSVIVTTAKELTLSQTVIVALMGSPVDVHISADADLTVWELSYVVLGTEYFANGTFDRDMNMTVTEATGSRFDSMLTLIQAVLTDDWKQMWPETTLHGRYQDSMSHYNNNMPGSALQAQGGFIVSGGIFQFQRYRSKKVQYEKLYAHAEKYLKGVLQTHFDPRKLPPVAKWTAEIDKLVAERSGLNQQNNALKDEVREAEEIGKSVYSTLYLKQPERASIYGKTRNGAKITTLHFTTL